MPPPTRMCLVKHRDVKGSRGADGRGRGGRGRQVFSLGDWWSIAVVMGKDHLIPEGQKNTPFKMILNTVSEHSHIVSSF